MLGPTIACTPCNGSGQLDVTVVSTTATGEPQQRPGTERCSRCNGSGRQPA
ncbi:hypothetical protein ACWD33_26230 [Streptomyces xiamenensis]|uniref:hypothetical protein n=1 Tax=Streptomyces xiamenensis TaxID=408015 RepID=UPI0035E3AB2A